MTPTPPPETAPTRIRKMAHCVVDPVRQEIRTPFENELPVSFGEIERVVLHQTTKRWLGIAYSRWQVSLGLKDGETVQLWEYAKERTARETMGMFRKNTDLPLWDCTTDTPTPYSAPDIQAQMLCQSIAEDAPPIAPPEGLSVKTLANGTLEILLPGPSRLAIVREWVLKIAGLLIGATIGFWISASLYAYLPFLSLLPFICLSLIALVLYGQKVRLPGILYGLILGLLLQSSFALYPAGGINGGPLMYLPDTNRPELSLDPIIGPLKGPFIYLIDPNGYIVGRIAKGLLLAIPIALFAGVFHAMDFPLFQQSYFLNATHWIKPTAFSNQDFSLWQIQDLRIETDPQSGLKHLLLVEYDQNLRLNTVPLKDFPLEETAAYLRQEIARRQRAMVKAAEEEEAS